MPAVVTFNETTLTIEEVNTGLDTNVTSLQEIYSEWKDWLLADATRMGYPRAFRQSGAEPISEIQNSGTTYFLNVGQGWRFKAADYDHRWEIQGNVFSDPETGVGLRLTEPTPTRTIEIAFFVSNLVDSSGALSLDSIIDGTGANEVDLKACLKYVMAMAAGNFTETEISDTIRDLALQDRDGGALTTLRLTDGVGRTRTAG
jgi:hypothetical protein